MILEKSGMAATITTSITTNAHEAFEIGVEAYHYFYPLVTMDVTRRQMTNLELGARPGFGPMNQFSHMRAFPEPSARWVVRPNFDTLYSIAWLDLTAEPMIVSVPDTGGRYYLLQMMDMWTDAFAVPGWRTSGTGPGNFGIVPLGWHGQLPPDVEKIEAPTPYVWVAGRTKTDGPADYEAVHRIQDGYTVTPLSRWGQEPKLVPFTADPTVDMRTEPLRQVNGMGAVEFFRYAAELMKLHSPHLTDWSILSRMRKIGIEVGQSFDYEHLPLVVQQALAGVPAEGLKRMSDRMSTIGRMVNGWSMMTDAIGVYGNAYLNRACIAMIGLGANQLEDAVYPLNLADSDGVPLNGERTYVLHFDKDDLPPVNGFWSVTMYDTEGFVVANPLNRYALGDRDALTYNDDGSLDLYLQHESPGVDQESNWLPAPLGPIGVTMRLYGPKPSATDGHWRPPVIKRVR